MRKKDKEFAIQLLKKAGYVGKDIDKTSNIEDREDGCWDIEIEGRGHVYLEFKNGRNRIFWGDGEFFGDEGIWNRNVNLWAVDKEV